MNRLSPRSNRQIPARFQPIPCPSIAGSVFRTAARIAALVAMLGGAPVLRGTTYSWGGSTGGAWSSTANWSPAGPPSTTGDTAILPDTATNDTVVYDALASGTVGTLNVVETLGANNELFLNKNLNVSNPVTLSSLSGTATLDTQGQTLTNSTLTIGSGGQLLTGSTGQTATVTFLSGALVLQDGGVISTNPAVGTSSSTVTQTVGGTGTFTMTGGILNINQSATGGTRFTVNNTFNATGGTINFSGSNSSNLAALYLDGASLTLGSGVTLQNVNGASANALQIVLSISGNTNQSFNYATSSIFNLHTREVGASGTSVKTVTYTGAGAGEIGSIFLSANNAGGHGADIFQFGSDLTVAAGHALPVADFATDTGLLNVDLNGFTYDGASNIVSTWTPLDTNTPTGSDSWLVSSSTGTGTFKASAFNFSSNGTRISVGPNVVLQAAGGAANTFSTGTGNSSVHFDPASLFYYTGPAATVSGSNTTLGEITVGDGVNTSTLTLSSTLTAAGLVTINNRGILVTGTATPLNTSAGGIFIASGGSFGAPVLTPTVLAQISGSSGAAGALAFVNLTASEAIGAGATLDLSQLPNVSLGGAATLTGAAGQLVAANSNYQIGSNAGQFVITGSLLTGANSVTVNGSVRLATGNAGYTGATVINNGGNLSATTNSRIPAGTNMTVNSGGTLDLTTTSDLGNTQTLASLSGAGTVTNTTAVSGSAPNKFLVLNGTANTVFSGLITDLTATNGTGGTISLVRAGTGSLTLNGIGNYNGNTIVNSGTLIVNGQINGPGAVSVSGSATIAGTLGGSGSIALGLSNSMTVAGVNSSFLATVAPGVGTTTTNTLSVGTFGQNDSVVFGANSQLTINVGAAGASDELFINGTLDLSGTQDTLTLNLLSGAFDGSTYIIAQFPNGYANPGVANVFDTIIGLPGNYMVVPSATDIELQNIPEPGAPLLALTGLALLMLTLRRRNRDLGKILVRAN